MVESFLTFLANLEATFSTSNPSALLVLVFLAAITDIGIPVPFILDTILILTAYHSGPISLPVVLIVSMLFAGRQIGSGVLYLLARYLGKGFIDWLKCRLPSLGDRLDSIKSGTTGWAPFAILTGRLTPGLLQITSVAAGVIRLKYYDFALGVAISSIIYDTILILLGFIAAHSPKSEDINFTVWLLISLVICVCILWPVVFLMLQRSPKKSGPSIQARHTL